MILSGLVALSQVDGIILIILYAEKKPTVSSIGRTVEASDITMERGRNDEPGSKASELVAKLSWEYTFSSVAGPKCPSLANFLPHGVVA